MKSRLRLLLLAGLLLGPAGLSAQDGRDALLQELRAADRRDRYLRITLPDTSLEGRVRDLERDSVHLAGGRASYDDIRLVEQRRKEGSGAFAGSIAGALVGMAAFVPLIFMCPDDCGVALVELGFFGASVGGTLGGLFGALAAPGEVRWEERWRATP